MEYRVRSRPELEAQNDASILTGLTVSSGHGNDWVLVNNNVKPTMVSSNNGDNDVEELNHFSVLDLMPETRYTLRMTAHNSAGSTVQEYDFTTLTFSGGKFISQKELSRTFKYFCFLFFSYHCSRTNYSL